MGVIMTACMRLNDARLHLVRYVIAAVAVHVHPSKLPPHLLHRHVRPYGCATKCAVDRAQGFAYSCQAIEQLAPLCTLSLVEAQLHIS